MQPDQVAQPRSGATLIGKHSAGEQDLPVRLEEYGADLKIFRKDRRIGLDHSLELS